MDGHRGARQGNFFLVGGFEASGRASPWPGAALEPAREERVDLRLCGFRKRLALAAVALLLASGCMVVAHPHPRLLTPQEAVNAATWFARSRGLTVDETRHMQLDRYGRWHVHLAGAGGRDHAQVVLDGYSGRVLSARLRGPRVPPPSGEQEPAPGAEEQPPPARPPGAAPKEVPPPPPATPPPPPAR